MRREWTEEEIEYLKEYYGQHSVKDIAEKLKRSYESVQAKAGRIGANTKSSMNSNRRNWTEREEKYMESRYLYQPVEITAKRLKRSVCSVKKKQQGWDLINSMTYFRRNNLRNALILTYL